MTKKIVIIGERRDVKNADDLGKFSPDCHVLASVTENPSLPLYDPYIEALQSIDAYSTNYSDKRKKLNTINTQLFNYMNAKYTLREVYKQIQNKTCKLPRRVREYVLIHYTECGEFRNTDETLKLINQKYL